METDFRSSFGIIVHNKKFLLLLRDNNPSIPSPNCWCVIGGLAEKGESPEQTFLREVKEETNLNLHNYKYVMKYTTNEGLSYVYYSCLSDAVAKTIKLGDEGQNLEFFSLEEIEHLKLSSITEDFFNDNKNLIGNLLL